MQTERKRPPQRAASAISVCFAAIAVLFAGCTSGPSDRQARADLQAWFESNWPGAVLVTEYATTNRAAVSGKYEIEYRAKGRFLRDTEGCVLTCCGPVCFDKRVDGLAWIAKASDNPHRIRKGDRFETRGKKTYVKTGAGWRWEEPQTH